MSFKFFKGNNAASHFVYRISLKEPGVACYTKSRQWSPLIPIKLFSFCESLLLGCRADDISTPPNNTTSLYRDIDINPRRVRRISFTSSVLDTTHFISPRSATSLPRRSITSKCNTILQYYMPLCQIPILDQHLHSSLHHHLLFFFVFFSSLTMTRFSGTFLGSLRYTANAYRSPSVRI